ncbi:alpha/beta fold hydrolase, partial [Patescibacteria group bacterium]|nr:alpha/beta fold hydrolase [Patescibacteria group bacterium]
IEINNSEISDNYAQNTAGAIYANHQGEITINNTIFNNNLTDDSGGAIRNYSGKITIDRSSFFNNKVLVPSYGLGGAIGNEQNGQVNITNSIFTNNTAAKDGGFLYNNGVTSVINSCISNNSNTALYNTSPTPLLAQSNFWGDSSGPSGAGPGTGDSISTNVDFLPFLTSCPPPPIPTPTPTPTPIPSPPPDPSKLPIVLLPGLGGSWNTVSLLTGTAGGNWKATPFIKAYDNLRETFLSAGYTFDTDFYEFNYDWRQPLGTLDDQLNEFINNTVLPGKPADTKINFIGHSLGGLLARTYAQNFGLDKVNQLVTVGSPHEGAIPAYLGWANAQFSDHWSWQWLPLQLYLHLHQGKYSSPVSAIQGLAPGLKDLLPIFEFVKDKPVNNLNTTNLFLINLKDSLSGDLKLLLSTIAGHENNPGPDTVEWMTLGQRTLADKLLDRWPDGRPTDTGYEYSPDGDLTVLDKSALLADTQQTTVTASHVELVETAAGIQAILDALNLTGITPVTGSSSPPLYPSLFFLLHSPATLQVTDPNGTIYNSDEDKIVLINNAPEGEYQLNIVGIGDGDYSLEIAQLTEPEETWYTLKDSISEGANDTFTLQFEPGSPLPDPIIDGQDKSDQAKIRLQTLRQYLHRPRHFYLNTIAKLIDKRPLLAMKAVYRLSRNSQIPLSEIDGIGQLILESYVTLSHDRLSQKQVNKEIKQAQNAKNAAERRLRRLQNKPRLGMILELADQYLDRAKNSTELYRINAN